MFKRVLRNYHETISINDRIPEQDGYILMYLSNENQEAVNIHWDDFTVYHGKTNVVSTQDYYPFGLTFNESVRVASTKNRFLYNQGVGDKQFRTERIEELCVDMTKYRMYDYKLGRFLQVDPLADQAGQMSLTPYHFALNNPLRYSDPYGDCALGLPCPQRVQSAIEFASGFANAVVSNHHPTGAGRGVGFSTSTDKLSYAQGAQAGDAASVVIGAVETAAGLLLTGAGIVAAPETGGASLVVSAEGVALTAIGANTTVNAVNNLNADGNSDASGDNSNNVNTKRDRQEFDNQLEKSQDQLDGIENAQKNAKKQKKGAKQNKIQSTKKSKQNFENDLKRIDNLDDLESGG